MTDHVPYRTDDMALAAFLMSGGAELDGLEPFERGIYTFRLNCPPNLKDAPHQYRSGEARVEPLRFFEALKRLKGQVARRGAAERRDAS